MASDGLQNANCGTVNSLNNHSEHKDKNHLNDNSNDLILG